MSSVASYRSSKVELKKGSKIAGRGIFAKEKINTNEIIAIKNGYISLKGGCFLVSIPAFLWLLIGKIMAKR